MDNEPQTASGKKKRAAGDAAATRQAILEAARALFAQDSYERVTLRKIAARAGIDAALIIRYFGSKEELFLKALTDGPGLCPSSVLGESPERIGERMLRAFIPQWDAGDPHDAMMMMMRSVANPDAAGLLRGLLHDDIVRPLSGKLAVADRQLHAELMLSQVIGLAVVRNMLRSEALAAASLDELVALVAPVLRHYLAGARE